MDFKNPSIHPFVDEEWDASGAPASAQQVRKQAPKLGGIRRPLTVPRQTSDILCYIAVRHAMALALARPPAHTLDPHLPRRVSETACRAAPLWYDWDQAAGAFYVPG